MSGRFVSRLGRTNPTTAFLATVVLALVALFVSGWIGAIILLAIDAVLAMIMLRMWPALDPGGRLIRMVALMVLTGLAVAQIMI